ncbi:MAG: NUDIX hydrolase [Acidimicrobiales bacterium]
MTAQIPRPPSARPGAPAPWAGLPADARRGLTVSSVVGAMAAAGRTGSIGQLVAEPMAGPAVVGAPPPVVPVPTEPLPAAVLVAVFEEAGEARVLLTRRAATLRSHRGEVSFPGGRVEPGEHVVAAALREAEEEVGLAVDAVRPVGWLRPLPAFSSRSWITPIVGLLDDRPVVVPSADEVARVFDVALADLLDEGVFHEERWVRDDGPVPGSPDASYPVWFFAVATEVVWGATARMLVDLLSVVLRLGG